MKTGHVLGIASAIIISVAAGQAMAIHAHDGGVIVVDESSIGLSLRAQIMQVEGEADEYVYLGHNTSGLPDDYKVSELNWDITSLTMAGGVLSVQFGKEIRLNIGGWWGIGKGNGEMDDYDWLDASTPEWTHWSHSDVDIESAYSLDINASFMFSETGPFQWHAVMGFKEDYWEWSDYAGTYIYSSDSGFRDLTGSFGGKNSIDYNQTFYIPYIGLKTTLAKGALSGNLYFLYSPLVWAEDEDHHILRDLYFSESFEGGDYFALGGELVVNLTDSVFISCSLDAQSIPEFTGDMTVHEGKSGELQGASDAAGIGNTVAAASASIGFIF